MPNGLKQQVLFCIGAKQVFQPLQVCIIVLVLPANIFVVFLICRGSLQGAISSRARRLLVCYTVAFVYKRYLRHYATNRKVAGSSPDEVDFFNWPNTSSRTMALESTQPLTEMSTVKISGG
jgi:hypothetical protein